MYSHLLFGMKAESTTMLSVDKRSSAFYLTRVLGVRLTDANQVIKRRCGICLYGVSKIFFIKGD